MVDVDFRVARGIGWITLERPRARNALTTSMVQAMSAALATWDGDDDVQAVAIRGSGDHGLCAGGDLRAMQSSAIAGDGAVVEFFRSEYQLNAQIARYPKPFVAIMDGITMGGGIGVSAHGSVRLVTERTAAAMPEVTIGLAPDVGGSWLLAHAPGEVGTYLAMTGSTLTGADAIYCGLADHYVGSAELAVLIDRLSADDLADVATHTSTPPPSALADERAWIDDCFTADTVPQILARLDASDVDAAREAARTIRTKSPRAVAVALASLRRVRRLPRLEDALEQEFVVSCNLMHAHDAIEGVRALIVDKDRNPVWLPASADDVTDEDIEAAFRPRGDGTLGIT
jgi:enoyl-CoA hydratase